MITIKKTNVQNWESYNKHTFMIRFVLGCVNTFMV